MARVLPGEPGELAGAGIGAHRLEGHHPPLGLAHHLVGHHQDVPGGHAPGAGGVGQEPGQVVPGADLREPHEGPEPQRGHAAARRSPTASARQAARAAPSGPGPEQKASRSSGVSTSRASPGRARSGAKSPRASAWAR